MKMIVKKTKKNNFDINVDNKSNRQINKQNNRKRQNDYQQFDVNDFFLINRFDFFQIIFHINFKISFT